MSLSFAALSHTGLRRQTNEDSYGARPDLGLFIVADGMGGHAGGEVASRMAVDAIETFIARLLAEGGATEWPLECDPRVGPLAAALHAALEDANDRIGAEAAESWQLRGMATTVAVLLVDLSTAAPAERAAQEKKGGSSAPSAVNPESVGQAIRPAKREPLPAVVAHVGDSRVYRWHGGKLELLTRDHSWVEEQVRAGLLTEQQGRAHPWRNLVTRALTGGADIKVDLTRITIEPGDRVLLCSDGLSAVLADESIAAMIGQDPGEAGLEGICESLVHAVNLAGGPDNVTVILVGSQESVAGSQ